MRQAWILAAALWLVGNPAVFAGAVYHGIPSEPDPERRYLFYLHGAWIETHGLGQPHPRHGAYEYDRIIRTLSENDYEVVSEARSSATDPDAYAAKVADQVRRLLEKGIPPEKISVIGHSKGGQMALRVASSIHEARVNYVILAGCGRPDASFRKIYEKLLGDPSFDPSGRILSIYDSADREAGSCREALSRVRNGEADEKVLRTGKGHGLFYAPHAIWVQAAREWLEGP